MNFNPREIPKAPITLTYKNPIMQPLKLHGPGWRHSFLPKGLQLFLVIPLDQSVSQVSPINKKLHQEWACVVGTAQGGGLRLGSHVAGDKGLACQLLGTTLECGFST